MSIKRTEHAGAKNGGGYWGPREDAKDLSRSKRRAQDRAEVTVSVDEMAENDYLGVLLNDAERSSLVTMARIDMQRPEVREVLGNFFRAGVEYGQPLVESWDEHR